MERMAKRLLDLIIVFFALPVMLIFIPLVALAIKLDSPGPVFYRQVRCGRSGKPFMIYKFRTMYVDAERDGKARWATKDDPRITRVGRLLRKTRLDELPQVLNILQGEMSIVGPRPERPEFVEELKQVIPYYHTRLLVKPGLTGWAQVQFNYTSSVEDTVTKLQYDLYYIHRWTLWLDIYIMFRTISVVIGLKGT
jgi:exopolysaccharide biosynthesis polyprenyl glycosylphosphotransferase